MHAHLYICFEHPSICPVPLEMRSSESCFTGVLFSSEKNDYFSMYFYDPPFQNYPLTYLVTFSPSLSNISQIHGILFFNIKFGAL